MNDAAAKLSITDWAKEDRPREKMLLKGVASLSNAELLAIILGSGSSKETAVALSQRILLSVDNDLNRLGKIEISKLIANFKGVGQAKAISIVACMELGKRRGNSGLAQRQQITCSLDIYKYFQPLMCDLPHEEFWILLLDRGNKIIDRVRISQGGVWETVVDSKIIFKEALLRLASGLVLCHNHPSGNMKPSEADDNVTNKIKEGAKCMDITVLDHIIVCEKTYYSYADEGKL